MADIGLNQNISTDSRDFHIQTATLVDEGVIRTEVFEKGRVLFVEHYHYERRQPADEIGADTRLREIVDKFHQSIIEEIDSLFEISERVFEIDQPSPHEKIGLVFLYTHIFDKAEKHFKRAIELAPKRHSSYVYLGRCYYLQKRYKQAFDLLTKLISNDIRFPDMYNLMGLIMKEKKQYRQAFQHFKEALKGNPAYIEAYFNLADAILHRIGSIQGAEKDAEVKKSISFLKIILKKIDNYGNAEDRKQSGQINKALNERAITKALKLIHEYRENSYRRRIPPEIIGYKFYLRLFYSDEELSSESLANYEQKISSALQINPSYPDLWHYLALIHLIQCRYYFLMGMENFRDATRINPNFERAIKNLRLVENDGREFLSLIKTIV